MGLVTWFPGFGSRGPAQGGSMTHSNGTGAHAGASRGRSERLDRILGELVGQVPEIEAASVVSFDGLPMASALPLGMDEDRVAAMSAALLSLGERAAEGLGRGELSQVYVEGENGTVFLVSADDEAGLVAVAGKGAKVGLMLFEVRRAAQAVAAVLRVEPLYEPVAEVGEVEQPDAESPQQLLERSYDRPAYDAPVQVERERVPEPLLQAVPEPAYEPSVEAYEPLATPLQPVSAASPASASWYAAETVLPNLPNNALDTHGAQGATDSAGWG